MKITTRIITGYGLFIAVLAGLSVYQIFTVNHMQEINQSFKDINFQNALNSFQAMQDMDLIKEFTEKSLRLVDPESRASYKSQLEDYLESFNMNLERLQSGASSDDEREEVRRLKQLWDAFILNLDLVQQDLPQEGLPELPPSLQNEMEVLRTQTKSALEAIKISISTKLDQSSKTSRTAQFVLVSITVSVLSVTVLVSFFIIRSISKPLAHLTEGTRAITEGKYFYRLDTTRNDEFAQLAKDFNAMIRRLSELDELKKDFISHVSHELKSPLASMRETVQILIEQIPGPLTDKQKRLLELNLQSGDRLTAMIRNLLDLSKIEAGTMEYELMRQDLVPLLTTAVAEFEVRAEEKRVKMEMFLPDAPVPVKCDNGRIVQVIVNLVGNAVKFSPNGGCVRIRLEQVAEIPETMPQNWRSGIPVPERDECYGLLSISDSGPGIADSDKTRVFEKFHQVQKGKKIAGQGVGLGLAICRTIVQAHRGAIWVEDNPEGGSCFFLLLSPGNEADVALSASQPI